MISNANEAGKDLKNQFETWLMTSQIASANLDQQKCQIQSGQHTHTHLAITELSLAIGQVGNFKCCQFPSQFNAKPLDHAIDLYIGYI